MKVFVLFFLLPILSAFILVFGGELIFLAALPWFFIIAAFKGTKS